MGFFSKIAPVLGGVAGFMVGGPAGAMVGASLGGAVAGAGAQSDGLKDATNATNNATYAQIAEQRRQYDLSRKDFSPFLQPSGRALATLQSSIYGGPQQYADPNYTGTGTAPMLSATWQPQESEGFKYTKSRTLEDLGRQLRMMGRGSGTVAANSFGRTLGDLNASNEETQRNELWNLVKTGQGATGSVAGLGANAANNISGAYGTQGQTLANISNLQGQNKANLWSGLSSAPLNIMSANKMGAF